MKLHPEIYDSDMSVKCDFVTNEFLGSNKKIFRFIPSVGHTLRNKLQNRYKEVTAELSIVTLKVLILALEISIITVKDRQSLFRGR